MILPVIGAAVLGALFANRSQPRTRCERKVVLGARTGRTYQVEEFPEAGFLIVRAPDAYGVFQHVEAKAPGAPRFSWRGGKGPGESLHGMCLDLGLVREQQAASNKQQALDPEPRAPSPEPRASAPKPPLSAVPNPPQQKAAGT